MLVNTELRDVLNEYGKPCKQLVVSYINNQGKISYLTYNIPDSQMYQWKYAKRSDVPDAQFKSWDYKNVVRVQSDGYLNEYRLHEILLDLAAQNPQVNTIHEFHKPDTYYCDIEVDVDDDGFPDADNVRNQVNTISWVHESDVYVFGRANLSSEDIERIQKNIDEHCKGFKTKYKFTYLYYDSEVNMLNDFFWNHFRHADCVTGWNFFGYDYKYLYNRAKVLGIDISYLSPTNAWFKQKLQTSEGEHITLPKHKLLYDYMEVYVKWDRTVDVKESNKLDWVSEKVLGIKKVVHQLGFKDLWAQKPADYVFYNAVDSILVREIDLKISTSTTFMSLASLMHVDALVAFSPVRSLEIVQCEYLYKEGRVMPNMQKKAATKEGYEGAFVYEPIRGIYKNVIALDFASLYPSTIRQFNVSPETFIKVDKNHTRAADEIMCTSGAIYKRNLPGFIPKICTDFYNKRKEFKKEMMEAIHEKYALIEIYEQRFGKYEDDD